MTEEVSDECLMALRAASEVIGEKCKISDPLPGKVLEIPGVGVLKIPQSEVKEVERILKEKQHLSEEQQLRGLIDDWGIRKAKTFCSEIAVLTPGTDAYNTCVKNTADKLARGFIKK